MCGGVCFADDVHVIGWVNLLGHQFNLHKPLVNTYTHHPNTPTPAQPPQHTHPPQKHTQAPSEHTKAVTETCTLLHALYVGIKTGIFTLINYGNTRPNAPLRMGGAGMGGMAMAPLPHMGLREDELRVLSALLTAGIPCLRLFGVTQEGHEEYDTFADVTNVMVVCDGVLLVVAYTRMCIGHVSCQAVCMCYCSFFIEYTPSPQPITIHNYMYSTCTHSTPPPLKTPPLTITPRPLTTVTRWSRPCRTMGPPSSLVFQSMPTGPQACTCCSTDTRPQPLWLVLYGCAAGIPGGGASGMLATTRHAGGCRVWVGLSGCGWGFRVDMHTPTSHLHMHTTTNIHAHNCNIPSPPRRQSSPCVSSTTCSVS